MVERLDVPPDVDSGRCPPVVTPPEVDMHRSHLSS
jgi:hypothetical protein